YPEEKDQGSCSEGKEPLNLYPKGKDQRSFPEGKDPTGSLPLPVSVNISRYDLFKSDLIQVITSLIKKYDIPVNLLRLEITESAFSNSTKQVVDIVKKLIDYGFTVEIDDFGSGYSSLNTLKNVPAQIVKLDMRFLEDGVDSLRGGNIIESIVRMAKWLNMTVIAEGVEEIQHADFLKSIGCNYIQGYLYARPMPREEYEALCKNVQREQYSPALKKLDNLNSNSFWDPKSMDTLIFNSFVGNACIYEFKNGTVELIRASEKYIQMIGSVGMSIEEALKLDWAAHLDEENLKKVVEDVMLSAQTKSEVVGEYVFLGLPGCEPAIHLRSTIRVIASTGERYLVYCISENITAQRRAEAREREASEQSRLIMANVNGGICAFDFEQGDEGKIIFANEQFYSLFGYTKEQFETELKSSTGVIHPDDLPGVMKIVQKIAAERGSATYKYRCIKRDGTQIYVSCNNSVTSFAGISDKVLLSFTSDITEFSKAEQKEREITDQLSAIMNGVNGGIAAITYDEKLTPGAIFTNDSYYSLFGYSNQEALEELSGIADVIYSEDRPFVKEQFRQIMADRIPRQYDYRCVKRGGGIVNIRCNASVTGIAGFGENVLITVLTDITKEVQTERLAARAYSQLEAITSGVNAGLTAVIIKEGKAEFIYANDKYYEQLGYTKEQFEREVENAFDLVHPEDRDTVVSVTREGSRLRHSFSVTYRIIRRDKQIRWIQSNISITSFPEYGDIPVQLSVANDITDQMLSEQNARRLSSQLQAVLDNVGVGITAAVMREGQAEILFANDKYYELLGYTEAQYRFEVEDPFIPIIEIYRSQVDMAAREVALTGKAAVVEFEAARRDGSLIWLNCTLTMGRFAGEADPIQLSIYKDITEQRLSQKAMEDTDDQLRFLNEAAHDLLTQTDTEEGITNLLKMLLDYFSGKRAYIFELNFEKDTLSNTYEVISPGEASKMENYQNISGQAVTRLIDIFKEKSLIVIDNVGSALITGTQKESLYTRGIKSLVGVSLKRAGRLIGFMGVDDPKQSMTRVNRLSAIGDYISVMLNKRDLNAKIENDNKTLENLMNDTPGGFVRLRMGETGVFEPVYFNKGFCELLETDRESLIKSNYGMELVRVHPEDRASLKQTMEALKEKKEIQSPKYRMKNGKGEYVWVIFNARKVTDEAGDTYMNVYYSNATAQYEAEQQQKELLDNLPVGAALFLYDGHKLRVVHHNKRYWELVGRTPGVYIEEALSVIHPDDAPLVKAALDGAQKTGENAVCDARILSGGGDYRSFRLVGRILPFDNNKYTLYVTYTPNSDEEIVIREMLPVALEAMMASQTEFAFVKDNRLRYVCCSKTFAQSLGLESEKDIQGKTDYDLYDKATAESYMNQDIELMAKGVSLVDMVEEVDGADGSLRYISTSKYLLHDSRSDVIGIYCSFRDVTQEKETDTRLKLLTDSIPGGIAVYEGRPDKMEQIRLTYYSDGFARLFGYNRQQYDIKSATNPMGLVVDEDMPAMMEQIKKLVYENKPIDNVYRAKTRSGGLKWINVKAVMGETRGENLTVNAIFMDVTERQSAMERLRISEEESRLALEHSGSVVCRYNVPERSLKVSRIANPIFEIGDFIENVPYGQVAEGGISPETSEEYIKFYEKIINGEESADLTYQRRSTVGWRWVRAHATTIFSNAGRPVSAVITYSDITEQMEKEAVFRKWQQSLRNMNPENYSMFRCNISTKSFFDSKEGKLLTIQFKPGNFAFDERTDEYAQAFVHEEDRGEFCNFLRADTLLADYYRGKRIDSMDYREITEDGGYRWLRLTVELVEYPNSKDVGAYMMFENIDERKREELSTTLRAETDPLTGVYNRAAFAARVEKAMRSAKPGSCHALMMLDIDGFKMVNDVFGHGAGDQALIDIAHSLKSSLRRSDLIGRLGGDEFLVFMENIPNDNAAVNKAKQICALTRKSFSARVTISGSIGIVLCPRDGNDFETLYKKVDTALYYVKGSGRDNYAFYRSDMQEEHPRLPEEVTPAVNMPPSARKRRMLIVDDNKMDNELLTGLFKNDFIIERAANGNAALISLRHYGSAISVVLLDLLMPGIDGFEVLRIMQDSSELRMIPVVVVSSDEKRDSGLNAIKMGASDFVVKPVDPDVLRIRVQSAVSKAENERLRAKNSFLEMQNEEIARYRTAIESTGLIVIEHDWLDGSFIYDTGISYRLAGSYDSRSLWKILLLDMVADTATVQRMQGIMQSLAEDREKSSAEAKIRLKTPGGQFHDFFMTVRKVVNEFSLTDKLIITLIDLDDNNIGAVSMEKGTDGEKMP
ncbi:MAG: PAS domain-containing protein, partial [Eubacteriaceae bacterium]|nr:PAS domain-containing protein [Eubacteriaceae bacterium]